MSISPSSLTIGWASTDITPAHVVSIAGQFHMRLSEGVRDPLTATAMALESATAEGQSVRVVMISCDVVAISDELRDAVRERICKKVAELEPTDIVLNATHTHTAPEIRVSGGTWNVRIRPEDLGMETPVMSPEEYIGFIADRIADAAVSAWRDRAPAGVGFGLAHATVGYNRRICRNNGETKMYGGVDNPHFSHVEAGVDPAINVLCAWDQKEKLTGVVVNIACPSQVSEQEYQVSADYWHETRAALRKQLGEDVYILPQCSAAGDIVPGKGHRTVPEWRAQQRMYDYENVNQRQDIARRITEAVVPIVKGIGREIDWQPVMAHRVETLQLPLRLLTEQDLQDADPEPHREQFEALMQEVEANPQMREQPYWYRPITQAYRRMIWNRSVHERYKQQQTDSHFPTEAHVIRLGDVAFATNQFEYYVDFGLGIKGRSEAVQTFIVQLAGPGRYLPTQRAAEGASYGAVPASTPVGPEGGRQLANWTIVTINELMEAKTHA